MRQAGADKLITLHERAVKAAVRHERATPGTQTKLRAWEAFDRAETAFYALVGKLTEVDPTQ